MTSPKNRYGAADVFFKAVEDNTSFIDLSKSQYKRVELHGVFGSLWSVITALTAKSEGGVHLVVAGDKDDACYIYNDIYNILEMYSMAEGHVFLLPTAYKRSVLSMMCDPALVASRTQALSALTGGESPVIVCTWPEALGEKVECESVFTDSIFRVKVSDVLDMGLFVRKLQDKKFVKTEFVSQPGEYALRGGIVDVFSYGDNKPYRIEFFDDSVESIRSFRVDTQLSEASFDSVSIIPSEDTNDLESVSNRISLMEYLGQKVTLWITSPGEIVDKINSTRTALIQTLSDETKTESLFIGGHSFLSGISNWRIRSMFGKFDVFPDYSDLNFNSRPQPLFKRDFGLLASDIKEAAQQGITTFVLADSYLQLERLDDIFNNLSVNVGYKSCLLSLHNGFSLDLFQAYTDHQIFERYQRYKLHNDIDRSQAMTINELNSLKIGDYVVHIDSGIGQFGGLVRINENGVTKEFLKISYGEGDVIMLGVANLHKISKYHVSDDHPPVLKRLGNGSWAKTKAIAKSKVKDMARELIKIYAERKAKGGFAYSADTYLQNEMEASFIWEDTLDQIAATAAVKEDMESPEPMDRLLCGDVGFGKTEVAIRAAFKAVTEGKQVAVLVPTTILALQHSRTFSSRLREFPVAVECLSRAKSAKQTSEILKNLKEGKVDILIGTHKILGKNVEFKDLGLLIIDEEQKFGVKMKEKLRELKTGIDTLTMTATPIPRTLQFSLLGARDLSLINTPPLNRQPINTVVQPFSEQILSEAIRYEINRGGQVFFLHNRINTLPSIVEKIRKAVPEAKINIGHGQMKPDELEKIILDFIYGEFNVLVCTSIIENGIDIPNANTIIINNAHMFGLADLHQMRGRVGRGNRKAFCYLLIPSFDSLTSDGSRRLKVIEEFSDLGNGFNIAMQDLDIRGAGNLFGAEQSGFVAEMGFETYQKIIEEAVEELKIESGIIPKTSRRLDCHVETSVEAYLPDDYIGSTSEKLRLYKEIDAITTDEGLKVLLSNFVDRFGPIPKQVDNLVKIVSLRNKAGQMGIEKIVFNPPVAKLFFSNDESFPFYSSDEFSSIMQTIIKSPSKYKLEQKADKLSIKISGISDIDKILNFN